MTTEATPHVESTHPAVIAFAQEHRLPGGTPKQQTVALYYAVRDGLRYDPYTFSLESDELRASYTLKAGRGWCVPKAILLAAACRALGIAARLGFADVRNHLSTARLREQMGTDIFHWHGYTAICLGGVWLKATPAFNIELCEKFGLQALDFDGETDAIYHPFDLAGNRHMEYLRYRGEFDALPLEEMTASVKRHYSGQTALKDADFDADVEKEVKIPPA